MDWDDLPRVSLGELADKYAPGGDQFQFRVDVFGGNLVKVHINDELVEKYRRVHGGWRKVYEK